MNIPLERKFYLRNDTLAVARDLLGKLIVVPDERGRRVSGMIVEVEAYLGHEDRGSHTYGGRRTKRTEATYMIGGHVYVFFVYGMYYQLNIVTGLAEYPACCFDPGRRAGRGDRDNAEPPRAYERQKSDLWPG